MQRRRIIATAWLLAWSFALTASAQRCPGCYAASEFSPFAGHGPAPDRSGRRVINVCFNFSAQVDNNGNSTLGITNVRLWNGLNGSTGAINMWNGAGASGYYLTYVNNCAALAEAT
jgi:hypothetical protein